MMSLSLTLSLFPSLITHVQPSQVGSLFTFLARQGAKHRASIRVDEHIYDQVGLSFTEHIHRNIELTIGVWQCTSTGMRQSQYNHTMHYHTPAFIK
jgi:hypothetical protein